MVVVNHVILIVLNVQVVLTHVQDVLVVLILILLVEDVYHKHNVLMVKIISMVFVLIFVIMDSFGMKVDVYMDNVKMDMHLINLEDVLDKQHRLDLVVMLINIFLMVLVLVHVIMDYILIRIVEDVCLVELIVKVALVLLSVLFALVDIKHKMDNVSDLVTVMEVNYLIMVNVWLLVLWEHSH